MPQKQVPAGEAPCALRTFKGFLFSVGALMALEVFETGKRALAGSTYMRPWLVGLGRGERCAGSGVCGVCGLGSV